MEANQQLINRFYSAFAAFEADTMASLYHPEAGFTDPVFGKLNSTDTGLMWRMLVSAGKDSLVIRFSDVKATENTGSAKWTADYIFSATGRQVHNEITAAFEFKDGKILRHTDDFSFWKWSRQALGITGWLLGWTPFLRNKVRSQAKRGLEKYSSLHQE